MIVDLRSDTLTRPTPNMLAAMMQAEVGDDVFGEDPTVIALQEKSAQLFGMEAALFVPSGTMANQISISVLTQPQDQVICDKRAHIYLYEGGGVAATSGVTLRLVDGDRGRLNPEQILAEINPEDQHFPSTAAVSLENTCNKGGGSIYKLEEIAAISKLCKEQGLSLHLDGARVFNALIETGEDSREYGKHFDMISFCLSKGLGAPIGSMIVGSNELIKKAIRVRKRLGGGMRQAGYLAAAGLYALENNIDRLKVDHARARQIGEVLKANAQIAEVMQVDTNIVIFAPEKDWRSNQQLIAELNESGIKTVPFGPQYIRIVTHLDLNDEMIDHLLHTLQNLK